MRLPVSKWALNPDAAYDSLQWPVMVGPHRYWYDAGFLRFERARFNGVFKWRLTALFPGIA